jgi:hypothetical protein
MKHLNQLLGHARVGQRLYDDPAGARRQLPWLEARAAARQHAPELIRRLYGTLQHIPEADRYILRAAVECVQQFAEQSTTTIPPTFAEAFAMAKRYESRWDVQVRRVVERWCARRLSGGRWHLPWYGRARWHVIRRINQALQLDPRHR